MKLYRVNKLAKRGGMVVKQKNVLAASDQQAVAEAAESDDCPVCDVLHNGTLIGRID
ncbi:hypothetical protein H9L12_02960 [Sphingomonas rhizophila]|uniref:Uncharacterized protein n=1 Tax=Sphingomonas rhizophila TaxID=2071607 RepID=A0A7G9SCI6_9SPHN|nr:hypothetical protein [Sphingomonas rhizophila]QNN65561.1 hypothetical protein H9L12_02960 [Sphingomonas rhizophila]